MASSKVYCTAIRLGVSTTTHDTEGQIVRQVSVEVTRQEVEAALHQFVGQIDQVPPMYSAIKRDGKRLYELARQGITVEVSPRQVDIYDIRVVAWNPPVIHLDVKCGPGTYIRALARDLGEALGCGAYVTSIRRTQSGQFTADQAVTLRQLRGAFAEKRASEFFYPMDAAFYDLPALYLNDEMARRLVMGQQVTETQNRVTNSLARAYAPGERFIALVFKNTQRGCWQPRKVFARLEDISPVSSTDARTHQ
jgi:tRNA pseudouridine55 synthase